MDTRNYAISKWRKANINVHNGDHIRFEDQGRDDETSTEPKMILKVSVLHNGEVTAEKEFSPNRTNLKEIQKLYGFDSSKWIGKEMRVNVEKVRNPQTNQKVDSVVLSAPGVDSEGNIIHG